MKTITQTRNYCDNITTRSYLNIGTFRPLLASLVDITDTNEMKRELEQALRMAKISSSSAARWVVRTRGREGGERSLYE